jgi:glycosyltransferase involved in cell wall biosynthesis
MSRRGVGGMKILFVHKQILFPRDTGGKIRVLNVLKHLGQWHDVTYVSNLRPGEEQYLESMQGLGLRMETVAGATSRRGGARFFAEALWNLTSPLPFTIARNYDAEIRKRITELLAVESYDLLICDTVVMAPHTVGLNASASILFQHNVEAQILKRHAEAATGLKAIYMRDQWRRMKRFEAKCGGEFDTVIAVSERDKEAFEREYGWRHCDAIDTAVDADFFEDESGEVPGRVTFLGSMDWMPNQDGVSWFVREVWPLIRLGEPDAEFHVVGRTPPDEIRRLAQTPGVRIVGGVPDVRPHLAQTSVFVVPILVGGGTRLKIFEAMASARAVVSTTIGAEGLPIVPGQHYLAADDPRSFADAVLQLLKDDVSRTRMRREANRYVRDRFSSEPIARQFERICHETVQRKRSAISTSSVGPHVV